MTQTPCSRRTRRLCVPVALALLSRLFCPSPGAAGGSGPGAPSPANPKAPYKGLYESYRPSFLDAISLPSEKMMKLSMEPAFFTLNMIRQDARANALVQAGLVKERQKKYRDALKMYQIVIRKYPHELYRVSKYGMFVPVSQYCQRRILNFPPADLEHYRTLHDAPAKEAFEQARRKHSLIGLSEIVDGMLATSYGSQAIAELGNAALDTGHYLAALEHFATIRDFFPDSASLTRSLDLKIAYCRRMLGEPSKDAPRPRSKDDPAASVLARLETLARSAQPQRTPFHSQETSPPHVAGDDYTLFPPTTDPIALRTPVWERPLAGGRADFFVYSQPVVTKNSVIGRHKNIVYSWSILNGEFRWVNDLGGRAKWQNWHERQYPLEDLVVQDGLVFTVLSKGGPSLVALDEVTGQLKWAYGPMVASTREEARMRFEASPSGGPRTIYVNYVLDNIEGETHTDTEYGVIAFESTSGRLLWRKPLCRLAPGKFSAGFAERRRNRIRSFTSPPLYSQGTVYCNTNAGAIAALDARSGRIKWLMRYPYHRDERSGSVHDATRQFGRGGGTVRYTRVYFIPHDPMFWLNQRPLLIGERLYVLAIDSPFMFCLNRRTGKVLWTKRKGVYVRDRSRRYRLRAGGKTHLLGTLKTGELVFVYSISHKPVQLVDPATGKTVWESPHSVERETAPCMSLSTPAAGLGRFSSVPMNGRHYELGARPLLTRDGRLYLTSWNYIGWPIYAWTSNMCAYDLLERKVIERRRYYSGRLLGYVYGAIHRNAPAALQAHEELPHKDARVKQWIKNLRLVVKDTVPTNRHGPFLPAARLTFRRYGVPFELRFGARTIGMVYDRESVRRALAEQTGPTADFARAELAFADARYAEAAELLKRCLRTLSSEDLDFRATVNQQLYRVYRRLARAGIRSGDATKELASCLGMSRSATTLADEIETLFALSEAYERQGEPGKAARCLRSIISTYGHHEYPVAEIAALEPGRVTTVANRVLDKVHAYAAGDFFGQELQRSVGLLRKGLPLYLSTVSPLPRTLTVRAGELAAARLIRLQAVSEAFRARFEATARRELAAQTPEERLFRLWEFPRTAAAQGMLAGLFERADGLAGDAGRRLRWQLADAARVGGLEVPPARRARVTAPPPRHHAVAVTSPAKTRAHDLSDEQGVNWLILERHGDRTLHPDLLFLGGRVRKRLDNKFVLRWMNLKTGRVVWEQTNIRLRGKGQEPGFFEAFVHHTEDGTDVALFHGLYDVLAYDVRGKDTSLRWRFRVPFDFEIKHAVLSGDLLILSGKSETLALSVAAQSPAGEVAWQVKEMGDTYIAPYFHADRLVSVRKMPFNVTVRYRATGRLMGRLELPDLSLHTVHPLVENGPRALPAAHDGRLLVVTDGWYYVLVDVERMGVLWKRLIDNNDLTREPAIRFALRGDYLAVLKEDYDQKVIYMLSTKTGDILWHTDPKNPRSPQPIHSMLLDTSAVTEKPTVYGLGVYPGQGFYFVGLDCQTGKRLFRQEVKGYQTKPQASLIGRNFAGHAVVKIQDRQDFELKLFSLSDGRVLHTRKLQGVGPFGVHGRVAATVQNGRLAFLSKDKLEF